jgi:hypothetical protein
MVKPANVREKWRTDNFRGLRLANEMRFSASSYVMRPMNRLKLIVPPAAAVAMARAGQPAGLTLDQAVAQSVEAANLQRVKRAKGEVRTTLPETAP